jgi:hypothetical protein
MDDQVHAVMANAAELQAKIDALIPPEVREKMIQHSQQAARIHRLLNPERKPGTPENDPAVPKEFLARYPASKDSQFLRGIAIRTYLLLQKEAQHSPVEPPVLRAAICAEYKAKHGQEPSHANLSRVLRQIGLSSLVRRGRPKKRK